MTQESRVDISPKLYSEDKLPGLPTASKLLLVDLMDRYGGKMTDH